MNTQLGTLAGVRMGDTAGAVERRLGPATYAAGFRPRSARRFTGPPSIHAVDGIQPAVAQYRDHAFLIGERRYLRPHDGRAGRRDAARRPYRRTARLRADGPPESTLRPVPGGEAGEYSWCSARIGPNNVFFGGNPIESITIVRVGPPARQGPPGSWR